MSTAIDTLKDKQKDIKRDRDQAFKDLERLYKEIDRLALFTQSCDHLVYELDADIERLKAPVAA